MLTLMWRLFVIEFTLSKKKLPNVLGINTRGTSIWFWNILSGIEFELKSLEIYAAFYRDFEFPGIMPLLTEAALLW